MSLSTAFVRMHIHACHKTYVGNNPESDVDILQYPMMPVAYIIKGELNINQERLRSSM